ncbi:MAG: SBBP repeat-containing protein [Polyangiaceae bacterium]|nr:SBBP repeat-containing protein [Polyangiaceae bacterium]
MSQILRTHRVAEKLAMGALPALLTMCAFGYDSLPFDETTDLGGIVAGMPGASTGGNAGMVQTSSGSLGGSNGQTGGVAPVEAASGVGGAGGTPNAAGGVPGSGAGGTMAFAGGTPSNGGTGGGSTEASGGTATGGSSSGGAGTGGAGTGGAETGGAGTGGAGTGGAGTGGAGTGGAGTGGAGTGGAGTGGAGTGGAGTGGAGTGGAGTGGAGTGGAGTGGAGTGGAPANAPSSVAASQQISGSGASDDYTTSVCVDASNNVQIGGVFDGTANFGGGNLVSGNQGTDGFFASYNSAGTHRWSTHPTLARADATMGLASTGAGTAFAISIDQGTLTLNGLQVATGTTGGAAVGVMDTNGQAVWMKRALLSTYSLADANTEGVAVGTSGNVFMFGAHESNLNVDGTVLNASGGSGYLAVFNSSGTLLAASTRPNYHWFQAIESSAATYAFGRTYNAPFNAAIATYTLGGVYSTVATFGAGGDDAITDAAQDPSGNIYITGYFRNSINFGGATLTTKGNTDIFVASFTNTLAHRWSLGFGSNGADQGNAIAVDKDGNVYLAGDQTGTINYGGGNLSIADGLFLVSLTSSGAHRWSQVYDGGPSTIQGLAVDTNYSLYIVGSTENLGIDMLGTHLNPANGSAFLVKLLQNP